MQNYLQFLDARYEVYLVDSDAAIVETSEGQRSMPVIRIGEQRLAIRIDKPVNVTVESKLTENINALEVFDIKGDEAYIGYKTANGNFNFIQVPFTAPGHIGMQDKAEPALSSEQLTREQHLLLDAKHQMEWMQRELDTLRIRVKAYDDIISVVKQQRYNDGCGVVMGTSPAFAIDEYFKERDAKNYQELKAKADGNGSQKVSR